MSDQLQRLLSQLKLSTNNPEIYQEAFTHRSFLNESKKCGSSNERLEFLGDTVLSFIVSGYLYKVRPNDEEGDLTNLRAFIVKTDSLSVVAGKLSLGQLLRLSKGEELSGGRSNQQILANTYEALLGAIYLDQGIDMARRFVESTLLPLFLQEISQGAPRDPKSQLQELVQREFQVSPKYKVITTSGPDHAKQFQVGVFLNNEQIGKGHGSSKQQAEEEATSQALLGLTKQAN